VQEEIKKAAEIICQARKTVALTGAGISVESGIPDFRSAGGLWERFDPMEYGTIQAFRTDPEKVWTMLHEMSASRILLTKGSRDSRRWVSFITSSPRT